MAHVVTCRVWLYTQHAVHYDALNMYIYIYIASRNGACGYMPWMAIHTTRRAL